MTKKINKLLKNNFNNFDYIITKNNLGILLKNVNNEDINKLFNYIPKILNKDKNKFFITLEEFVKEIFYINNLEFSFYNLFKTYYECNIDNSCPILTYLLDIRKQTTPNIRYNNLLLEIIACIFPTVSNDINLTDFIENMSYKISEPLVISIFEDIEKGNKKEIIIHQVFPLLYPQYADDFIYLSQKNSIPFDLTYYLFRDSSFNFRKCLYHNDFLLNNLENIVCFKNGVLSQMNIFLDLDSFKEYHVDLLLDRNFAIFVTLYMEVIYIETERENKTLKLKKISVSKFCDLYHDVGNLTYFKERNFYLMFFYKLTQSSQNKDPIKEIKSLKCLPFKHMNHQEQLILIENFIVKNLKNYKKEFNPLNIDNYSAYCIFIYIFLCQKQLDKENLQKSFVNSFDLNTLTKERLLITLVEMINNEKYSSIFDIKEISFLDKVLKIDKDVIKNNEADLLEMLLNQKLKYIVKIYHTLSSHNQRKRYIYIIKSLILKRKLDDFVEHKLINKYLNNKISVKFYNEWKKVISLTAGDYSFEEITDLDEKWDIGISPVRTCISWDRGIFKNSLPYVFSPNIKIIKIIKNDKVIGRSCLSISLNKNNEFCLIIHKIYLKNNSIEQQKLIGELLFNSLKEYAIFLNTDLLLFIGRKRNLRNELIVESYENDISFTKYSLYLTKDIFSYYFDPLSKDIQNIKKATLENLLFDKVFNIPRVSQIG